MNDITFTQVQYIQDTDGNNYAYKATIDGIIYGVPFEVGNRHYDEIQRQVEAGTLTIQEAD